MGNFRMKNFTGLHGRAGLNNPQGNATTKSSATTPITQRSKSPLKMNEALVAGAAYAASSFNDLAGHLEPAETNRPKPTTPPPAAPKPKTADLDPFDESKADQVNEDQTLEDETNDINESQEEYDNLNLEL
jgi:hypothetical protein